MDKTQLDEEVRHLVIERLKLIPAGKKLSVGGSGDFTIAELINNVKKNNDIGKKIVEVQMQFLQSLKTGALLDE
jgi:hypothetical protein